MMCAEAVNPQDGVTIRTELTRDTAAIATIVAAAFGGEAESRLVSLLRARGEATLSLVAEQHGRIIGHVIASPIRIDPALDGSYLGIAPLSVQPEQQRQGVGSQLMKATIAAARTLGVDALFLLGEPSYYSRFGFTASHLHNEYGATDAFMHLELQPDSLAGTTGTVRYAAAFRDAGT